MDIDHASSGYFSNKKYCYIQINRAIINLFTVCLKYLKSLAKTINKNENS